MLNQAPVRLCCGERHYGAICPDGLVMCCLCFFRVPISELSKDGEQLTDVCQRCHKMAEHVIKLVGGPDGTTTPDQADR
jgi:hypothetical protein